MKIFKLVEVCDLGEDFENKKIRKIIKKSSDLEVIKKGLKECYEKELEEYKDDKCIVEEESYCDLEKLVGKVVIDFGRNEFVINWKVVEK